ncbi:MAG: hypothetical protein AABX80_00365 [Nanoarchaeota archaeon]
MSFSKNDYEAMGDFGKAFLVIGGLSVGLSLIVGTCNSRCCGSPKRQIAHYERFNTFYDSALVKYANKDKEGFVTSSERDVFYKDLLKDKKVK